MGTRVQLGNSQKLKGGREILTHQVNQKLNPKKAKTLIAVHEVKNLKQERKEVMMKTKTQMRMRKGKIVETIKIRKIRKMLTLRMRIKMRKPEITRIKEKKKQK